jgi:hypothetical protein
VLVPEEEEFERERAPQRKRYTDAGVQSIAFSGAWLAFTWRLHGIP